MDMDDAATERLRHHGTAVAAAELHLTEARKERDDAIRRAVAARLPIASIARATGMSRQAVYDIAGRPSAEVTP